MATKSIDKSEYSIVCALLRAARTDAGLSQGQLGLYLDRPQTFVSSVELGARRLDALQLREWCAACRITFPEFATRLESALALERMRPKPKKKTPAR